MLAPWSCSTAEGTSGSGESTSLWPHSNLGKRYIAWGHHPSSLQEILVEAAEPWSHIHPLLGYRPRTKDKCTTEEVYLLAESNHIIPWAMGRKANCPEGTKHQYKVEIQGRNLDQDVFKRALNSSRADSECGWMTCVGTLFRPGHYSGSDLLWFWFSTTGQNTIEWIQIDWGEIKAKGLSE